MENAPETIVSWLTSVFGENPSWDLLLLMVVVGLILALAFWGRAKIVAVVLASYGAIVLMSMTGVNEWVHASMGIPENIWGTAGVLLVTVGVMFALVQYSFGGVLKGESSQFAKSVILAVSAVGLLASYWFSTVSGDILSGFSPLSFSILGSNVAVFAWVFAPLVLIGLTDD